MRGLYAAAVWLKVPAVPEVTAAAETITHSQLLEQCRLVRSQSSPCVGARDLTQRHCRTSSSLLHTLSSLIGILRGFLAQERNSLQSYPDQKYAQIG